MMPNFNPNLMNLNLMNQDALRNYGGADFDGAPRPIAVGGGPIEAPGARERWGGDPSLQPTPGPMPVGPYPVSPIQPVSGVQPRPIGSEWGGEPPVSGPLPFQGMQAMGANPNFSPNLGNLQALLQMFSQMRRPQMGAY